MSDLKDILSNHNEQLPDEKLMAYLEGTLPPEEQHAIEQWLVSEGMEADALEGLRDMKPADVKDSLNRINHKLRKDLLNKRHKRRRQIANNPWALIAIAVIIMLVILTFIVIKMSFHK